MGRVRRALCARRTLPDSFSLPVSSARPARGRRFAAGGDVRLSPTPAPSQVDIDIPAGRLAPAQDGQPAQHANARDESQRRRQAHLLRDERPGKGADQDGRVQSQAVPGQVSWSPLGRDVLQ